MGNPHAFDVALGSRDLQGLTSPDALVAFFAQLGYPTDSRLEQLPEHLGIPQRFRGELRRIERLAADPDGLEIYLFELRSVTLAATRLLGRALRDRGGDFLLVLASVDYDRIDFVLLERVDAKIPANRMSSPRVGIRPRILTLDRRHPGSRQVRVLRRFTWTEADAFAQFEKLRSAYDLADWSEELFNNRALFSDHYLLHRLPEQPEWRDDPKPAFQRLRELCRGASTRFVSASEAEFRRDLLLPIFEVLGFQTRKGKPSGSGSAHFDLALYGVEEMEPLSSVLAYPWNRFLDGKDPLRDHENPEENPGALVVSLLEHGESDWAIVTNGRLWRLYSRRTPARATNYYEIDLHELVTEGAPGGVPGDAFRFFWLLFRRQSLEKRATFAEGDPIKASFLDQLLAGSDAYARELGERLKEQVFEHTFPALAAGFQASLAATKPGRPMDEDALATIHSATLTLLYRLLFLLYAESRSLLPLAEAKDYFDASLERLKREVAEAGGNLLDERNRRLAKHYSTKEATLYGRLERLFGLIDRGAPALNLPAYNGGLFVTDPEASDERPEAEIARFLHRFPVPDFHLACALDQLARDLDAKRHDLVPIDYKSLGVRQLGSIYEGLLEFRLQVAGERMVAVQEKGREVWMPARQATERQITAAEKRDQIRKRGDLYLENDKHERRATGSYYTPDPIVKYIVAETVGPILSERFTVLEPVFREAQKWHGRRVNEARAKGEAPTGATVVMAWRERLLEPLFDIKVIDPAMGSGHFLVETVDFVTDRLLDFLNGFPWNPVQAFLEQTRNEILSSAEDHEVTLNPERLTDVNLLKRHVLKRCVYGVDLNLMAVELAKVSLWLHCFTLGAPLSFLDHHLRFGNSLVGVGIDEVRDAIEEQKTIFGSRFAGLLLAADLMRQIGELPDATAEEVAASRRQYREASDALAPFKLILDVYTSQWFGNGVDQVKGRGRQRISLEPAAIQFLRTSEAQKLVEAADQTSRTRALKGLPDHLSDVAGNALEASRLYSFFHWELEFPEVFFAKGGRRREAAGFDAVVGNPPYVRMERIKPLKPFLKPRYSCHTERADLFIYFYERAVSLLRLGGAAAFIASSTWTKTNAGTALRDYLQREATILSFVDFGDLPVFAEVTTYPCIMVLSRGPALTGHAVTSVKVQDKSETDFAGLVKASQIRVPQRELAAIGWHFEDRRIARLREKIQAAGVPLKEYCGSPLYGIKTGLNEAFVVEQATRDALVAADPGSIEILKPFLEGRDLKPWRAEWQGLWLLYTHHGVNIRRYPAILEYLRQFKKKLEARATSAHHEWYELQQPQFRYSAAFQERKILWRDISDRPTFSYDNSGFFIDCTIFALAGMEPVVLAALGSSIGWFFLLGICPQVRGGFLRLKSQYIELVPIPSASQEETALVASLLTQLVQPNASTKAVLAELDDTVSRLFGLNQEDRKVLSGLLPKEPELD